MKSYVAYFDRSSLLVIALLGGCQPAKAFECTKDADCTLGGQQGICAPTGRCAYPSDSCASGYAYPQGAGPSLAGVCLPPGIADTDTDGPGTGTSGTTSGASSGMGSEASVTG